MIDTRTREQLSAEIAERLFGLKCIGCWEEPLERCPVHGREREFYAGDHNAALGLVVPEMRKRGYIFEMKDMAGESLVTFWKPTLNGNSFGHSDVPFGGEPRAICEAALAAMDAEEAQGNE